MEKYTVPGLVISLLFLFSCKGNNGTVSSYEFQSLRRGSIAKTVSSTGSLKPIATVNVFSQISGKVEQVLVDYNDEVKKDDVLAVLNTDTRRLQRNQLEAQVKKARSAYELQEINHQNQERLAERNLISQYELRQSRNQLESQAADLAIAEANLRVAETEINHYAFITSPIDGTILSRNVSEGGTVVEGASANSTAIFVIAENLREMQIESWVGELDISSIREGQQVRFTLEALPGRSFNGAVSSKRLSPSTQDGVVSYNVIVIVDNADLSLLPGMTCNLEFIEESRENVLLVSNAALRYTPSQLSSSQVEAIINAKRSAVTGPETGTQGETRDTAGQRSTEQPGSAGGGVPGFSGGSIPGGGAPGGGDPGGGAPGGGMPGGGGAPGGGLGSMAGGTSRSGTNASSATAQATQGPQYKPLWFLNAEGKPDCLLVIAGISDGSVTEVSSTDLTESLIAGTQFIVRERVK
ncbi:MAG: efflux RND transporter periplasmic adaptor subunit [Treponema sp.]|jgi:HlyD family secretion protein|nr:efflux RND transporter periplasmic adaptor subunit [Treponema sp.]